MEEKVKKAPRKKAVKAEEAKKETSEAPKKDAGFEGTYFYGLGKRKTAIAQVRIYPNAKGEEKMMVNGRELKNYFGLEKQQSAVKAPFVGVGMAGKFDVSAKVMGGGIAAQAEAIRLGITRALVVSEPTFRKALKDLGYLTRDARVVERKKPGLKKARRSPQWAKR